MELIDLIIFKNRQQQNFQTLLKNRYLFFRVFRAYFKKVFLKQKTLRMVEIAVGYECNAKCKQCSCALSLNKKRKRLSILEFKKLINEAMRLGAFQFNLTGGEPLIYLKETLELINYIRKKGAYVHLCTNGILLDQKKLQKLKQLELNSLEFGLDSASEKTHDANRQKGAFKKVMKATLLARKLGITVLWDTIITRQKIKNKDMAEIVKLAKRYGVYLQITPPCVMGRWRRKKEILLNEKETQYFKKLLTNFWVRTDTYSSLGNIGCPAAREKLAVNPYGDVLLCSLIQTVYGNIRHQSLSKIQEKMINNLDKYSQRGIFSCLPSFNRQFIEKCL